MTNVSWSTRTEFSLCRLFIDKCAFAHLELDILNATSLGFVDCRAVNGFIAVFTIPAGQTLMRFFTQTRRRSAATVQQQQDCHSLYP
jgi:hypothetical protein